MCEAQGAAPSRASRHHAIDARICGRETSSGWAFASEAGRINFPFSSFHSHAGAKTQPYDAVACWWPGALPPGGNGALHTHCHRAACCFPPVTRSQKARLRVRRWRSAPRRDTPTSVMRPLQPERFCSQVLEVREASGLGGQES